jgi:hypothetical protein
VKVHPLDAIAHSFTLPPSAGQILRAMQDNRYQDISRIWVVFFMACPSPTPSLRQQRQRFRNRNRNF